MRSNIFDRQRGGGDKLASNFKPRIPLPNIIRETSEHNRKHSNHNTDGNTLQYCRWPVGKDRARSNSHHHSNKDRHSAQIRNGICVLLTTLIWIINNIIGDRHTAHNGSDQECGQQSRHKHRHIVGKKFSRV